MNDKIDLPVDTGTPDYIGSSKPDYIGAVPALYSPAVLDAPAEAGGCKSQAAYFAEMQAAAERLAEGALHHPITMLLQDQRKDTTRRGYRLSLSAFFKHLGFGPDPSPAVVRAFVGQEPHHIALQLAGYRAAMLEAKLSASTINTRMAPIRSLLAMSLRMGWSKTNGRDLVKNEKSRAYRDTRGPLAETVDRILAMPDRETLKGKRDYAILRLFCDNGLRLGEVAALTVPDFDPVEKRLQIFGKGQTGKDWIELAAHTARAVYAYLSAAPHSDGALFRSFDHRPGVRGEKLTPGGLRDMVRTFGERVGIHLTPHKFRHYTISWLAVKTDGNVPLIMQFSRHVKAETVMRYVDNVQNKQGALSRMLAERHGE